MTGPDTSGQRWVVSPLASAAWRGGRLELGAAGAAVRLTFVQPDALLVVHAFAEPTTIEDALARLPAWPSARVVACVSELIEAGLLDRERPVPGAGWDPHSLAFHRSSRAGAFRPATGGSAPEDTRRPAARVTLDRPAATGALASLLGARRSTRSWPQAPIPADVFSRLLWLSAGDRDLAAGDRDLVRRDLSRPYPSGGGVYSVELYVVAAPDAVKSLATGVYRYLPREHALCVVSADPAHPTAFLAAAARSAGSPRPPVVLLMTSRYALQAERYGTLAYSLILKEVGALFQTLHLVAEDLGLGACALGAGTPDRLLAQLCGVDEHAEPVVGEFIIGPR